MSVVHQSPLPLGHVVAEIAAYPFASERGLRIGLVALDPELQPGSPTTQLWRQAERDLVGTSPGLSIDELIALRDRLWFGAQCEGSQPIGLRRCLGFLMESIPGIASDAAGRSVISTRHPLVCGLSTRLRLRESARWLTFALPRDLL